MSFPAQATKMSILFEALSRPVSGIIILAFSALLSGCGSQASSSDGAPSDAKKDTVASTAKTEFSITGSFVSSCTRRISKIENTEKGSVWTVAYFSDEACKSPLYSVRMTRTYEIGSYIGESKYEINFNYTKVEVWADAAAGVTELNSRDTFGKKDWKLKETFEPKNYIAEIGKPYYVTCEITGDNYTPELYPANLPRTGEGRATDWRSSKLDPDLKMVRQ